MWIHNFLSNRQQCVAVNGTTSSEAQVRSGVPQGSVLGPLLFLIHISDNYEITDLTVSCFADDTRILLWIKDEEDTQMLLNDLHMLYKWADTNNMKCNANRFELMLYGKEQEIKSATINLQIIWWFKHRRQRTSQRSGHNDEQYRHFYSSY